ncbi:MULTISPECIES: 23S rRNA (guanosine(2251)-2'-O)-methyltransferase RlmB [Prochlorococcus]|uniref:23S rRNA (guanosine(2251)-2'-O)-methyltransferase RlmB n=1 Tax=Prochlorococcus TaxID=1218 RepID=UPI000533842C|nr:MULTISPECIES: 23S rRNA (guanosine(2251)-2'-O)-methyltransferase RlmB [Prochlorococcus]KGG12640.1 23S rRNA (guanosine-2'-O-) -methyltransferase rlmB LSU rRNA Gm2251 [Prochlorococcus sp. MIT 0601]
MTPANRRGSNFSSSSGKPKGGNRTYSSRRRKNSNLEERRRSFKSKAEELNSQKSLKNSFTESNQSLQTYSSRRNSRNKNNFSSETQNSFRRTEHKNNSTKFVESKDRNQLVSSNRGRSSRHGSFDSSYAETSSETFNNERDVNDIFWGRHSTQAILESGRPLHRIWCTPELRTSSKFLQLLKDSKALGVLVEEVSWARLGHITKGGVHQGIALQTAASETLDLSTLIKGCSDLGEFPVLLALDGLTDPHNVGAIVRSAEAFGAHGLILPQRRSAGLTGSVAKVAAGALEHLPVARVVNLNRSLEELKKFGYRIIGLAEEGENILNEIDVEGPLVIVIGSEGKGLSVLTRRTCDQLVRIPLRGVTSSLNASVATSIFLYEIASKGWMKGMSGQAASPKLVRAKLSN